MKSLSWSYGFLFASLDLASAISCDGVTEALPVRLQFAALVDMSAFGGESLYADYREGFLTAIRNFTIFGEQTQVQLYAFNNRNPPNAAPVVNFAGKRVANFSSPLQAADAMAVDAFANGLLERPNTDASGSFNPPRDYGSMYDSLYHSLSFGDWIIDEFDEIGRPVVRFVHIASDVPAWFGGTTSFAGLPPTTMEFAKAHTDPNAYYTEVDYIHQGDLDIVKAAVDVKNKFTFYTITNEGSHYENATFWYVSTMRNQLSSPLFYGDTLTKDFDSAMGLNQRVYDEVCRVAAKYTTTTSSTTSSPTTPTTPTIPTTTAVVPTSQNVVTTSTPTGTEMCNMDNLAMRCVDKLRAYVDCLIS